MTSSPTIRSARSSTSRLASSSSDNRLDHELRARDRLVEIRGEGDAIEGRLDLHLLDPPSRGQKLEARLDPSAPRLEAGRAPGGHAYVAAGERES